MITQVRRWLPERSIVVVADSSFAALELLNAALELPLPIHLVTRLRLDAALYQPAKARQYRQMGRPRKVGKRLATLKTLLGDATTVWQSVTMTRWYGGSDYSTFVNLSNCRLVPHWNAACANSRSYWLKTHKVSLSRKRFYALI
jgi:hypothetical protein